LDNEHFNRQHTTQTNKLRFKLKLKQILYNIPLFLKRENAHILRKHCQDLYKPARAEQISAAILLFSTLNTECSIFIEQNKKIIIIKQLKTVNLFFYLNVRLKFVQIAS
jgi:hypothetical protein